MITKHNRSLPPPAVLLTQRLILEPMSIAHSDQLFNLFQDPELNRWTFREVPNSIESFREGVQFLEGRLSRDGLEFWPNWIFKIKTNNDIAGKVEISLDPKSRTANLAYYTFSPFQRNGYAKEACRAVINHIFSVWNCRLVYMEMNTANTASISLAESLGAVRQKPVSNAQEYKGKWHDEYRYELCSSPG